MSRIGEASGTWKRWRGERECILERLVDHFCRDCLSSALLCGAGSAFAADGIEGRVLGGGLPIANSTVTLWAATADAPKQLAQAKTNESGGFEISAGEAQTDAVLYLVATGGEPKAQGSGDNPAIALMTVVGSKPPHNVVINEMTTIGLGDNAFAVYRWYGYQRERARTANCRRQRAQLRGSRERQLRRDHSGCP